MHRTIAIITLTIFLINGNIFLPLQYILSPSSVYAEIVENIENTCPSDPTQNGKCALVETITDNPSCKDINGQQVCKDWWRKDFKYKCSGAFDPDTILAKVGNQYCDYKNECVEWIDVEKHGGETSCRIYVDVNRPGCNENSYGYNCIVNDCGDLFNRCSMKQYVKYSDIQDRANVTGDINCDTSSWQCGAQIQGSSVSGIKLGLYTFACPSEVRKVCKTYAGKVKCPDGREQVCNKVKTCKKQKTVDSKAYELKSCIASRNMQSYSYLKNSTEANNLRSNNTCIKTGEVDACTPNIGCADSGSYGEGFFNKNSPDWGYIQLWGVDAASKTIKVHAYAAGGLGHCGDFTVNISVDTPPGTQIGTVYPHWEGSCQTVPVTYEGYQCSGGCVHSFIFHGPWGNYSVNVPITKINENFNCYQDSYQDCSFGEGLQCNRLSSLDINDLECVEYDLDTDNAAKNQCKKYIVNYDCPTDKQITECAEHDEVLKCNDGIYPIRDVRTDSYDFSADFSKAMALAQATNELKHVWSGEPYRCESGTWWMFDSMSLGDYFMSKLMSYAFQYLGSEIISMVGNQIAGSSGCAGSLINTATAAVKSTYGALDTSNIRYSGSYTPSTGELKIMSSETQGVWDTRATLNTGSANSCFATAGMNIGNTIGLTPEQSSKIIAFMGNPIVQFTAGFVIDMVTSIKNCSTCTDEKCATKYNQYKEYSLISNRLCHITGSKCTWQFIGS